MADGDSTPFVRLPAGDTFTLIDEADAETLPHRRLKVNESVCGRGRRGGVIAPLGATRSHARH